MTHCNPSNPYTQVAAPLAMPQTNNLHVEAYPNRPIQTEIRTAGWRKLRFAVRGGVSALDVRGRSSFHRILARQMYSTKTISSICTAQQIERDMDSC